MKRFFVALAAISIASFSQAKDSPAGTVKLTYVEVADVSDALAHLDGSTRLDKDNAPVQIAFELKGKVRLAIARDLKALQDAHNAYISAWQAYLKGAGITDESKETADQKKAIKDILEYPADVPVTMLEEPDLVSPDTDRNPIPPTVIARLLKLIK